MVADLADQRVVTRVDYSGKTEDVTLAKMTLDGKWVYWCRRVYLD